MLNEALKNDIHIETSSAFDINIVEKLAKEGKLSKDRYIVCNGYKRPAYVENIARLINNGFSKTIPVIDNMSEVRAVIRPSKKAL